MSIAMDRFELIGRAGNHVDKGLANSLAEFHENCDRPHCLDWVVLTTMTGNLCSNQVMKNTQTKSSQGQKRQNLIAQFG
eukprot:5046475-Amphidinium_carterae.1